MADLWGILEGVSSTLGRRAGVGFDGLSRSLASHCPWTVATLEVQPAFDNGVGSAEVVAEVHELWANAFGIPDNLPFADLSEVVSPSTNLSGDHLGLIDTFSRSPVEKICLAYILKWYQIPVSLRQGLSPALPPDPYLPLLKLFELGGSSTREHRVYIDVYGSAGIHAGVLQYGNLYTPYAVIGED